MLRTEWLDRSSMKVWIEVTSPYSGPTVELRMFESDRSTPLEFSAGSLSSWPMTMEKVVGEDRWEVVVDADDLDIDFGQALWIEVEFDNGADNRRVFTARATVKRG